VVENDTGQVVEEPWATVAVATAVGV